MLNNRHKSTLPSLQSGGNLRQFTPHFRSQEVAFHQEHIPLSASDEEAALQGQRVYITGEALAKVHLLCEQAAPHEVFFYFLASVSQPLIIDEIYVPEQQVSAAFCHVDGSSVLRAGRAARALNKQVIAAGHSHGRGFVFTSHIDSDQMIQLSQEGVGLVTNIVECLPGTIDERKTTPLESTQAQLSTEDCFEASFEQSLVRISIGCPKGVISAADLKVTLERPKRQTISTFATANADGEHLFPAHSREICAVCGAVHEHDIDAGDVTVHVLGPVTLTPAQQTDLEGEVAAKVRCYRQFSHYSLSTTQGFASGAVSGYANGIQSYCTDVNTGPGSQAGSAPFELTRRGKLLCRIPGAILEEAACLCNSLAVVLGWKSDSGPSKTGESHG